MKKNIMLLCLALALLFQIFPASADCAAAPKKNVNERKKVSKGHKPQYRTPLAGEGFRSTILGYEIVVPPRNRRSEADWDVGAVLTKPAAQSSAVLPIGSIYIWQHPDESRLFRARFSIFDNSLFLARSFSSKTPFEWLATFRNYTVPFSQAILVDGATLKSQELVWGYALAGFGIGYRRQVSPGKQENMFALDLKLEPGFEFFNKGSNTAQDFIAPANTFEVRGHLQMRLDKIERNILELPQKGLAAGADIIYGRRLNWREWGVNGSEPGGRDYYLFTGYVLDAGGIPGVRDSRQKLIGSLHGGAGIGLDRFSAPRVGGGVNPMGEEYGSTWMPVLPGAAIEEFFPKHYIIATGEYGWEPVFFTYLGLDASAAWLDRLRMDSGNPADKNGFFFSLGGRIVTGFLFQTRLQVAYNYNFSVIRKGHFGGGEIVISLARSIK